ncbi:MAG: KOW domain-containing RNA-binding protein [Oscillospiraceae bacterium]|nr:KOW domain-containing RNA-binding protein [Oscillospiraceae bacterium]
MNNYILCKSAAGHDKGSWYAVVRQESGFVYIADGRRRKLNAPKKKNIKHVELTRKTIEAEYSTDKSLRKALWEYNFGGNLKDNEGGGDFG